MVEAPEKIWAWPYKGEPNNGNWMVARFEKGIEYVRADRIEALERQLAEARAVLQPLAMVAEIEDSIGTKDGESIMINVNLCRRARAALSQKETSA